MKIDLKIPNLGEAEDTEIIEVSISKGEKVKKNDPLIVLESEKAAMEVPADYDGVIVNVLVKEGESVSEGKVYATLEVKDEPHINDDVKSEKEKIQLHVSAEQNEVKKKDEEPAEQSLNFANQLSVSALQKPGAFNEGTILTSPFHEADFDFDASISHVDELLPPITGSFTSFH